MTLDEIETGKSAVIDTVGGTGHLRQHLLDMGIIPGARVKMIRSAPMGDPLEFRIHDYELTLRAADAGRITVKPANDTETAERLIDALHDTMHETADIEHPGLGEEGKYHVEGESEPLPEGTTLTFALAGNQNSGKTTLFNQLTGATQRVGNFPGVTVDRKDGIIRGHPDTLITDLPGIYSMSPYSGEEIVSRNFILNERPKAVINIVDATNIERNLYLTIQLLEMQIPTVIALNMMDELSGNGGTVDINRMESLLGVPVVPISALKNEGVDELVHHAVHIAKYQEKPKRYDFCDENDHNGAVHRAIHAICHLIADHAERANIPLRFAASKVIENDELVLSRLGLEQNEREMLEHIIIQMEHERGLDRNAAMADMRFAFIEKVCAQSVVKPKQSREHLRSQRLDSILTGKYTAIPVFVAVMAGIFWLTFEVIGAYFQEVLEGWIDAFTEYADALLTGAGVNDVIHGFVVDGIFAGIGSVLSFLPIIITLFFFLSILEDSGYTARVAFFMDKLLRKIGLSGRSIVPMLIGFGCTVPAVMSTRTLPSERDRRMTILLTPFMSCTAKLPIYAFFVDAFFPKNSGLIMTGLYLLGIVMGILVALLYKNTLFRGEAVPFVMELPNYRLPGARNVLMLMWEKAKDFIQRAFSVIFVATVVIWFLQSFDFHFNLAASQDESILAALSGMLVPLFRPLGLGDWRICTALISGFLAKESVVSSLNVLFGNNVGSVISSVSAASLLVFSLLYTPCVAAVASIRREMGGKWALGVVVWQCAVAWAAAMITRWIILALI
ncbi:MAG: ferrous iron transport protein B [Synergistaceae bacterium]|nr:ferrous iron transport protein B [Synergistaceae bacterium]